MCLAGNHDLLALGPWCFEADFNPDASAAGRWTKDVLDDERHGSWLESLEPQARLDQRGALSRERARSRLGVRARRRVGAGDVRADRGAARPRRSQPRALRHLARGRRAVGRARSGRDGDRPLARPTTLQPGLRRSAAGRRLRERHGYSSISMPGSASFRRVRLRRRGDAGGDSRSRPAAIPRRATRARHSGGSRRRRSRRPAPARSAPSRPARPSRT